VLDLARHGCYWGRRGGCCHEAVGLPTCRSIPRSSLYNGSLTALCLPAGRSRGRRPPARSTPGRKGKEPLESRQRAVREPSESRRRAVGEPLESRWRAVEEPLESRWRAVGKPLPTRLWDSSCQRPRHPPALPTSPCASANRKQAVRLCVRTANRKLRRFTICVGVGWTRMRSEPTQMSDFFGQRLAPRVDPRWCSDLHSRRLVVHAGGLIQTHGTVSTQGIYQSERTLLNDH
jgi:hypothetical protein